MFQFPSFHSLSGYHIFNVMGCPIRTSADQRSFATPYGFSQLTTSFVYSKSLGIRHTPLFRFLCLSFTINYILSLIACDLSIYFFKSLRYIPSLACNLYFLILSMNFPAMYPNLIN